MGYGAGGGERLEFVAFTTMGLEQVTEREIEAKFPSASISGRLDKRIIFSMEDTRPEDLLGLRTVDDVHLLLSSLDCAGGLDARSLAESLPLDRLREARSIIGGFRALDNTFSLTVSRYKNRDVDLDSARKMLADAIARYLDMDYVERDHTNFDIRLHIESSSVFFSCRLAKTSLYVRQYRECEREGSLKPPIAAALCMLVRPRRGERMVDNFCGTGTILCEAALQGFDAYGGDIDMESVNCANVNMRRIPGGEAKNVRALDARSSKWPSRHFDYAISNYPWGKQVPLNGMVKLYADSIAEYARILKDDGSIVLLGMKPDLIAKHLKRNFPDHEIVRFRIGFLGQNPWVVCAKPKGKQFLI